LQYIIETGDRKISDIPVRINKLPDIFYENESAQDELVRLGEADYTGDREEL